MGHRYFRLRSTGIPEDWVAILTMRDEVIELADVLRSGPI